MLFAGPIKNSFALHGVELHVENACAVLREHLDFLLRPFASRPSARVGNAIGVEIAPFDLAQVTRCLSRLGPSRRHSDSLTEIYSAADAHVIVDDRWGVCEVDLLRHRCKSWLLPRPTLDAVQLADAALLHPLALLLRLRGIELIPALTIERAGWGALILNPYPIAAEIARLLRAGYRIIGQRWSILEPRGGRTILKHLPGCVESAQSRGRSIGRRPIWTDLTADNPWASSDAAWCDAVLAISPGRRVRARGRVVPAIDAPAALRRTWPSPELPASRPRLNHPAAALARDCLCLSLELSRSEDDFLDLVEFARRRSAAKPQVSIATALRRPLSASRPSAIRIAS